MSALSSYVAFFHRLLYGLQQAPHRLWRQAAQHGLVWPYSVMHCCACSPCQQVLLLRLSACGDKVLLCCTVQGLTHCLHSTEVYDARR